MKKNTQGSALVVAMGIILISSLLAYTILEYMIPFSRNIKGIENATKAYYYSNSGLEKGLYYFSTRQNQNIVTDTSESTPTSYATSYSGSIFSTYSSGSVLPEDGKGTSEFDSNWNTVSIGNPIQLSIGYGFIKNISDVKIYFRTPDINGKRLQLSNSEGYISWTLSSHSKALYSNSGSIITGEQMDVNIGKEVDIKELKGMSYNGGTEVLNIKMDDFFTKDENTDAGGVNGVDCTSESKKCILKFSLIRDLESLEKVTLPYLEWKLVVNSTSNDTLPLRYSIIKSTGKSGLYARELEVKYPQETVNQALDFAVFQ